MQEIIASNAKSGKKLKVAGSGSGSVDRQPARGLKLNKPVMRFDDDFSSRNEVATVNGDVDKNGLKKIGHDRSRDK